jgi:hypothetical protein
MLTAVPKFFQLPATELNRYRENKLHDTEQSREVARRILEDPEASDRDREWARAALELL